LVAKKAYNNAEDQTTEIPYYFGSVQVSWSILTFFILIGLFLFGLQTLHMIMFQLKETSVSVSDIFVFKEYIPFYVGVFFSVIVCFILIAFTSAFVKKESVPSPIEPKTKNSQSNVQIKIPTNSQYVVLTSVITFAVAFFMILYNFKVEAIQSLYQLAIQFYTLVVPGLPNETKFQMLMKWLLRIVIIVMFYQQFLEMI
jgi:hypothetical protein